MTEGGQLVFVWGRNQQASTESIRARFKKTSSFQDQVRNSYETCGNAACGVAVHQDGAKVESRQVRKR
jgi:hypothetical protein